MRLIDHYKADTADALNTGERQDVRLDWLRALILTLHERALTVVPVPTRRTTKREDRTRYVRWEPFWHALPDDELYELADLLGPYYKRPENRGLPL